MRRARRLDDDDTLLCSPYAAGARPRALAAVVVSSLPLSWKRNNCCPSFWRPHGVKRTHRHTRTHARSPRDFFSRSATRRRCPPRSSPRFCFPSSSCTALVGSSALGDADADSHHAPNTPKTRKSARNCFLEMRLFLLFARSLSRALSSLAPSPPATTLRRQRGFTPAPGLCPQNNKNYAGEANDAYSPCNKGRDRRGRSRETAPT